MMGGSLRRSEVNRARDQSEYRPASPDPETKQTTGLTWTHPTKFGTEREETLNQWLFDFPFIGFGMILAGMGIKIYILEDYSDIPRRPNPPWDHRWGP